MEKAERDRREERKKRKRSADIIEGSKGTNLIRTYNIQGKMEVAIRWKQSKGQQDKTREGAREQKESRRRSS